MSLYEFLKENKSEVICCDRTGNIISVYCKDDVKVQFVFPTVPIAQNNYRKFRRELESIKV